MWITTPTSAAVNRSAVIRGQIQKMIREGGHSNHSAQAHTLRRILFELEAAKIPYTLTAIPGVGYIVDVKPPGERQ